MTFKQVGSKIVQLWEQNVIIHGIITLAVVLPTAYMWAAQIPVSTEQLSAFWALVGSYAVKSGVAARKG